MAIAIGLTVALILLPVLLIRILFVSLLIGALLRIAGLMRRKKEFRFDHAFAKQWQNMSTPERESYMARTKHTEMAFPKLKERKPCRNYNDQFLIY